MYTAKWTDLLPPMGSVSYALAGTRPSVLLFMTVWITLEFYLNSQPMCLRKRLLCSNIQHPLVVSSILSSSRHCIIAECPVWHQARYSSVGWQRAGVSACTCLPACGAAQRTSCNTQPVTRPCSGPCSWRTQRWERALCCKCLSGIRKNVSLLCPPWRRCPRARR